NPAFATLHAAKHRGEEVCQVVVEPIKIRLNYLRFGPRQFLQESTKWREGGQVIRLCARAPLNSLEPCVRVGRIHFVFKRADALISIRLLRGMIHRITIPVRWKYRLETHQCLVDDEVSVQIDLVSESKDLSNKCLSRPRKYRFLVHGIGR